MNWKFWQRKPIPKPPRAKSVCNCTRIITMNKAQTRFLRHRDMDGNWCAYRPWAAEMIDESATRKVAAGEVTDEIAQEKLTEDARDILAEMKSRQ
jgi:hypothetical protein